MSPRSRPGAHRDAQNEIILNLEDQSSCWEALAETRAELVRNLRIELGEDPDADDEREQL
jgi:hypothetical protein